MSVRKRIWTTKAVEHSGWQADYVDAKGKRRRKMFERKKDADAFLVTAKGEVRDGVHVPDSASITIAEAGKLWIATAKADGLEQSTIAQYTQHLDLHITPFIGDRKLSGFTVPDVRAFEDQLREAGRSRAMIGKVRTSLGSIFSDAQERGSATRNPVHEMRRKRKGKERRQDKRHNKRLMVGVDIPTRDEIKTIIGHAQGRWRPMVLIIIFGGLRISEVLGLRWIDLDLAAGKVHIRQRADRYAQIGSPKSAGSSRTISLPPMVINALKEWKLACPKRETAEFDEAGNPKMVLDLVFPTGKGNVESRGNFINRGLIPLQVAAGVTKPTGEVDEEGRAILTAKYTGAHAFRHFYASWCINRKEVGGLGLTPKDVQERLGHSSIVITMDTYGHLFPSGDDAEELAAAERSLLG